MTRNITYLGYCAKFEGVDGALLICGRIHWDWEAVHDFHCSCRLYLSKWLLSLSNKPVIKYPVNDDRVNLHV